jgi:hypothetical protein
MEYELFPQIHLKVGQGISLSMACWWMYKEEFQFISHKKGLYFNGHDHPDVVVYHQDHFLPSMKKYESCVVHYTVGDMDTKLDITLQNYVERQFVLTPQDEMTSQANNSSGKTWMLDDQHRLQKKGPGHGIHKSDVICSTMDWLEEASQTLEYRKNFGQANYL